MTKKEFLIKLREGLSGLPKEDIEERVRFYSEMIDDRIEEGLSEEEAVLAVGSIDEITAQAFADVPFIRVAKEKLKSQRNLSALEIVLLVLGSPIWLSLLIAAVAVAVSLYAVLWAVIISFWAVFAVFVACFLAGTASGTVLAASGRLPSGLAMLGAGIICAGFSVFAFFGCFTATKGAVILTKKIGLGIKKCFVRKGRRAE